jgi:hypothetical protein
MAYEAMKWRSLMFTETNGLTGHDEDEQYGIDSGNSVTSFQPSDAFEFDIQPCIGDVSQLTNAHPRGKFGRNQSKGCKQSLNAGCQQIRLTPDRHARRVAFPCVIAKPFRPALSSPANNCTIPNGVESKPPWVSGV